MSDNTDEFLVKLKNHQWSDERIAEKLGISVEEVRTRWERIVNNALNPPPNQFNSLVEEVNRGLFQYQLLGETLKSVCTTLGNRATPEQVLQVVGYIDAEVLTKLMDHFLVLNPHKPIGPQESYEQALKRMQS